MRRPNLLGRFGRDRSAASAVEFALVATPFILLTLGILQVGFFYMAQSSLDTGVVRTADDLRTKFNTKTVTTYPTATALKSNVATYAGGLVKNDSTLKVEIRQLAALGATALPITDGVVDYGVSTTGVLVIRASTQVTAFAPGFSALTTATSSAIVRRQGR